MSAFLSRIDQAGRISISAQQRRALGLEAGSPIVISVVGHELRIRSMNAAMAELQSEAGQFLQKGTASVDAFIAQRRSDWDGEERSVSDLSEPKPDMSVSALVEPERETLVSTHAGPEPAGKPASRRVPVSKR